MSRIGPRGRRGAAVAAAALAWTAAPAAASNESPACRVEAPSRIVAVGDVHGAFDRFTAVLRAAQVIDRRGRWTGGDAVLVQTGDVLDRGADSRRALDLLRRLEREAPRAGGRVLALLGNHEVMVMLGDYRYVSAGEYAAFRSPDAEALRERYYRAALEDARARAKTAAQPFVEMAVAMGPRGEYGAWLRDRPAMARINGIAFVHGGISPAVADLGCDAINATIREEVAAIPDTRAADPAALLATREDGPLWYRGLAAEEAGAPEDIRSLLDRLDARAIVIGHTVAPGGRIAARAGGRVLQIDTGMLGTPFFPGGRASALEIRGGALRAIYEDGSEALPVMLPPPAAAPAQGRQPAAAR
jgi:hypothetical protein